MAYRRAMAAGLCLLSAQLHAGPAAVSPEEDQSIEEAALVRDRYERMTVPVTIDGAVQSYRFLIDTGAQATVVTHRIVADLALPRRGQALLVAMGSSEMVDTVEVDRLEFANRTVSGLIAPLLHARNIGADGILGLDSLQDLRVLIDFREERMLVADSDAPGSNAGYEIVVRARRKLGQMVITDARVDKIRVSVVIDTGAQNTVGNRALLRKLRSRSDTVLSSVDVHGAEVLGTLAFARSMEIGGLTLGNVPIGFVESPIFAALGLADRPAVVLGIGNLRVFDRVAIDFASRRILFDLPGTGEPDRARAMFRPPSLEP